jgi:hypothetical protein
MDRRGQVERAAAIGGTAGRDDRTGRAASRRRVHDRRSSSPAGNWDIGRACNRVGGAKGRSQAVSAQSKTTGARSRKRLTTWLAWAMLALALVLIALQRWVVSLPHPRPLDIETGGNSPFAFVGAFAFSIVGALIVSRYPRHPIGWIFCAAGLLVTLTAFTTAYSQYAGMVPGVLPAGDVANAISGFSFFSGFLLPITYGLLLFPDGRLPSRGWSPVAWLTGGGFVLIFLGNGLGVSPVLSDLGDTLSAVGGIALLASVVASATSLILRWRRARGDERQQLKWIGSAAAILMVVFPSAIIASVLLPSRNQDALFFIIATWTYALIPIAAGVAILKYRLYEIDILINRTLVYVPLTAILAGTFAASITLTQKLFIAITGQSSEAATVLTTLIVVAAFDPLKTQLQHAVDKRFKTPSPKFGAFGEELRAFVELHDPLQLTNRLLNEAVTRLDASGGAIYLTTNGHSQVVHQCGAWTGDAKLSIPLVGNGAPVGTLALGAWRNGAEYAAQDRVMLQQIADLTARAIAIDERANGIRQ